MNAITLRPDTLTVFNNTPSGKAYYAKDEKENWYRVSPFSDPFHAHYPVTSPSFITQLETLNAAKPTSNL